MTRHFLDGEVLAVPTLHEYWRNPQKFEDERNRQRAIFNASLAAHDARVRQQQEARWSREEQS